MIMVRVNATGDIGFIAACWPQAMVKQSRIAVPNQKPETALVIMCAVAVGEQYAILPLGETTPVYELPEEGPGDDEAEAEELQAELGPGKDREETG